MKTIQKIHKFKWKDMEDFFQLGSQNLSVDDFTFEVNLTDSHKSKKNWQISQVKDGYYSSFKRTYKTRGAAKKAAVGFLRTRLSNKIAKLEHCIEGLT